MKTTISLLLAFLLISLCAGQSLAQTTVRVSNAEELLAAIAPNTTVELEDGVYDLGQLAAVYLSTDYTEVRDSFDGQEYLFNAVENLTLKGIGKNRAEILNMGTYSTVMLFRACHNLKLENLEVGHGPNQGDCTGAVFSFEQMHDVSVENCLMYGSGTYGIVAEDVQNLTVANSIIRNCTYGVLTLTDIDGATFTNVQCYGNKNFDMFEISNCRDVLFDRCEIKDNSTGIEQEYCNNKLFNVSGRPIELRDCIVRYNTACYLYNKANAVKITGSTLFSYNNYLGDVEP